MANRLQRLDVALARCYENDLNWTILPEKLYEVIIWPIIFMNQTKLIIRVAFLKSPKVISGPET